MNYGRIPSPPDERDFQLSYFLEAEDPLIGLLKNLDASKSAAASTKRLLDNLVPRFIALEAANKPNPPTPPPTPVGRLWTKTHATLDQGQTPHCVGFGWVQWGNTQPIEDSFSNSDGNKVYYECKVIDGEPKEENGSYVRSGAKAMQDRGKLKVYAFTSALREALQWVLEKGPVVVGTDFMYDMETPDTNGFVKPTGGLAGGHCYLMVGYDGKDVITFLNSWGSSWGQKGYFKMKVDDFADLVTNDAEMCATVEV